MADVLQIGQFATAGPLRQKQRFVADFDLNPGTGVSALVRDTLVVTAPEETAIFAKNERRYGGSRRVAEVHDNGQVEFELYLKGATPDASLALFDGITAITEDTTTTRYLRWRPDGATRSVYYEIRGNAWDPKYRWIEFSTTRTLHIALSLKVAPLAFGDPYDVFDDFATDTITAGDYTFGTGGGTLSVSGGQLVPSTTAAKRAVHTGRGYKYTDAHITMKTVVGASAGGDFGVIGKYIDDNNYLYAKVTTSFLQLFKVVGGVATAIGASGGVISTGGVFIAGATLWVRLRIEDNVVSAELWSTVPPSYNGNSGGASVSVFANLTPAEAAIFGRGIQGSAGFFVTPNGTDYRYDDFRVDPFSYYRRKYPDTIPLYGVPGTAPASVDTVLYHQSQAGTGVPPLIIGATPSWTLMTWTPLPKVNNMVPQGSWELHTIGSGSSYGGWLTGALTGFAAATSAAVQGSGATFGSNSALITVPNTAWASGSFPIYQKFYAGRTYTVQAYIKPSTAVAPARLSIVPGINTGGTDIAFAETSVTASPTLVTFTWTPTADYDYAYIMLGNNATLPTGSRTISIDGLVVFDGTTAPTQGTHASGDGAAVPFGVIQGEAAAVDPGDSWSNSGFQILAAGGAGTFSSGGFYLAGSSSGGIGWSGKAAWVIDPNLLTPDDFSGDVTLEVWARVQYASTEGALTAVLSAVAENGGSVGTRYTKEYGSAGKTLPAMTSGTRYTVVRLGTIVLPAGDLNAPRWGLGLNITQTAGVANLPVVDYLFVSRARARALLPTGKALNSTYPQPVFPGVQRITRELAASGGSWATVMAPSVPDGLGPLGPSPGMGGQLVEFPPGNVAVALMWADHVPDDPSSGATGPVPTAITTYWAPTVHFSIIPRYYLTRSA